LESPRKTKLVPLNNTVRSQRAFQGALVRYLVMERLSTAPDIAEQVADL
jgi:hypothetical protein